MLHILEGLFSSATSLMKFYSLIIAFPLLARHTDAMHAAESY